MRLQASLHLLEFTERQPRVTFWTHTSRNVLGPKCPRSSEPAKQQGPEPPVKRSWWMPFHLARAGVCRNPCFSHD